MPAGALSALGLGLDPGGRFWMRADPVHLRADRDRVLLFPSHGFTLEADEAEQLGAALERHFADLFELRVLRPDVWVLGTAAEAALQSKPPLELADLARVPVYEPRELYSDLTGRDPAQDARPFQFKRVAVAELRRYDGLEALQLEPPLDR